MGIIAWIVLGLLAGALARFLMPGTQSMGWIMTFVLGVVGAYLGGWVGAKLGIGGAVSGINLISIATATGGALLVLFVVGLIKK